MRAMKIFRSYCLLSLSLLLFWASTSPLAAQKTRIRVGTVAPAGSPWHETLQQIRQDWHRISGGQIQMTIYPGGVLGDEDKMVRKVRAGILDAVGLSSVGLSRIDRDISCLQIPLMFDSYEELDYVRERIGPGLEEKLEARGFKLLHWTDAGWVHSFAKTPVRTPDELRQLKLFTSAGDPETEKLYEEFGFQVIPLSLTDMLTSLQTGMIEAVNLPPLFALLNESYRAAPHMLDVRWTPLVAGTVISTRVWERIPEPLREELLASARRAGQRLRGEIRKLGDDAILEMEVRGLTIMRADENIGALWQAEAEKAYPQLRGRYASAELFDEVARLRDEFRALASQTSKK